MKTYRRYILDKKLSEINFFGRVLDIGGKRTGRRGSFIPPLSRVDAWEYLNIDPSTEPDYLCSAENITAINHTYNFVLLAETLEHLENPEKVLVEITRILKSGGYLIMTIPFLYQIHGDPSDFQRWTADKISLEIDKAGLIKKEIEPMGGLIAVISDIIYGACSSYSFYHKIIRVILYLLMPIGLVFDSYNKHSNRITTGYFVTSVKR